MTARAQIILVAVVLLLIGAVDFVQRIYVPRSVASREAQIEVVPLPGDPMPLASAQERLQSWFPVEAPTTDSEAMVANASDGAAAALPDRVDIAGWRFILRGVFDAGPEFAVLDVMSTAGGETEQHRLLAGDEIKGVSVERISGRSVYLSDGETIKRLALFVEPEINVTPANDQK